MENREEKRICEHCNGKGTYSQMHGISGSPDFIGDKGFEEKPSIHHYPCKTCNGTGFRETYQNKENLVSLDEKPAKSIAPEERVSIELEEKIIEAIYFNRLEDYEESREPTKWKIDRERVQDFIEEILSTRDARLVKRINERLLDEDVNNHLSDDQIGYVLQIIKEEMK